MDLKLAFEALLRITQEMLAATDKNAWESLASLELERARIIEKLPAKLVFKSSSDQHSVVESIKKTQAIDLLIRETVEPLRTDVADLLARLEQKS